MKKIAIVGLLAVLASAGAIVAACADTPPAQSPANSTSSPADTSSAMPAGSAAPK
ncbi:MAG: hypothetical protein M3O46_20025 [Myxococcota bacterium]|nr:hypothetical protein [Myxococcota bacterium]